MESFAQLGALGDVALWSLVVGFISPPVVAVLQQARWSARTRSLVAFAFYLVIGFVGAALSGVFTTVGITTAVLVVFVTAANSYRELWKKSGVTDTIEAATTPKRGRHEAGAPAQRYPLG